MRRILSVLSTLMALLVALAPGEGRAQARARTRAKAPRPAAAAPAASPAPALTEATFRVERHELPNGLVVLLHEDHAVPTP